MQGKESSPPRKESRKTGSSQYNPPIDQNGGKEARKEDRLSEPAVTVNTRVKRRSVKATQPARTQQSVET